MEGLGLCEKINFLTGIARGVTTPKSAAAHGPCFLTGSYATKKLTAAPLRSYHSANRFSGHRRTAIRDGFLKSSITPADWA